LVICRVCGIDFICSRKNCEDYKSKHLKCICFKDYAKESYSLNYKSAILWFNRGCWDGCKEEILSIIIANEL